jgi:FixJ family two-component response regulator
MNAVETTVFVIDDDKAVRTAIRNLLESVGIRVETFNSPQDFLNADRKNVPGCLVLDVRLQGISGLDFQKQLAAANIEIPIIFITGHGDIPMTVQAMKAGAVDFLTKPFRDQDFLDAIQKAVERDRDGRAQEAEVTESRRRFNSLTPRER